LRIGSALLTTGAICELEHAECRLPNAMESAAYNWQMAATLIEFARVNDAAAAQSGKLAKQKILAEYFRSLADERELRLAVRFSCGRAFPSTDERVLGVSGAIVSDVIIAMTGMDPNDYSQRVVRAGEIGEALAGMLADRGATSESATAASNQLSLPDIESAFDDLASTGNMQRKREIVRDLLTRCTHAREAAYLCKIIFSDLRTGAREGIIQAAIAQAFGHTLLAVQRCQLLVGDLDQVAVLAKNNVLDQAKFKLFHPIQFMLATPQETAQEAANTMAGRAFYAQDKLDGIRAQVHKSGDRIAIYTRTMDRIDESFPEVADAIRKLPGEFLLDGEIVPWRNGTVLPFAHLQRRLGRKSLSAKMLRENPTAFIAFDLLYRDGVLLMERPLRERIEAMGSLLSSGGAGVPLLATETVSSAEQIDHCFCRARDCRNEGLVLKDPESIYAPGKRGRAWLKIKTHLPTLDCVVTAAEYGHGKRRGVLSDYTFGVWDRDPSDPAASIVNVGKAFSGVTDEEIAQLTEMFLSLSRRQRGHVHDVEPKIVMEIAFDQIQKSARHASGYALRFPRIKRIRWDKKPEDADWLSRVVEIYESSENFAKREIVKEKAEPGLFDEIG
jgi:DNA ligase-1